jgi:hypothetical protein
MGESDMAESKKPDFTVQASWWHNPDHLKADTRSWLEMHAAASGLDAAQQKQFIAHANQIAQIPHAGDEPIAMQRDQLDKVAKDARRLLASLNAMSQPTIETLGVYTREACIERPSPLPADMVERIRDQDRPDILERTWDWVNALEAAALYAMEQQEPSRQDKPKQARARGMVASLADCYIRLAGKAPPADPAGWFAEFAGQLAQHMGLAVGSKVLKSGIAQARR